MPLKKGTSKQDTRKRVLTPQQPNSPHKRITLKIVHNVAVPAVNLFPDFDDDSNGLPASYPDISLIADEPIAVVDGKCVVMAIVLSMLNYSPHLRISLLPFSYSVHSNSESKA